MDIITCTESIRKFLIILGLKLLLTQPQLNHLASFISSGVRGGFNGKIINVPELSMRKVHRTSVGNFLAKSPWATHLVLNNYQFYVITRISQQALKTGCPIYVVMDDTIAEKTKPSSKAKRPIAGCGFHYSHLKKKKVYGHQVVCVLLECGGIKLPYYMKLYDKQEQSKIDMVQKVIEGLPNLPGKVYVFGDSWYSSQSIIKRGFHYIGALKTNRVLYTPGGSKLGKKVKEYAKTLTKNDVCLVTVGNQKYWVHRFHGFMKNLPKEGVIILSWPENKLFDEDLLHVFYSTDNSLSVAEILQLYTERWTIEVFFRQTKMQLELDRYQVRKLPAIKRFFLLIMIVYAYCDSLSPGETVNLCALRKSARMEIKREVVSRVYSQAVCGVSLSDINQELGIG
jgi:hypothetical protein